MKFTKMTDSQWHTIEKHLPRPAKTGRPRVDDRTTINATMFVLITGCRWIDLPAQYVPNHQLTDDSRISSKEELGKNSV